MGIGLGSRPLGGPYSSVKMRVGWRIQPSDYRSSCCSLWMRTFWRYTWGDSSEYWSIRRWVSDYAGDGSIMIVVATDAPLDSRNLTRLGRRALAGLARTGSSMTNGSGDYVIVFSTVTVERLADTGPVPNDRMSPLFQGTIEATEEAIYNSLFLATAVEGYRGAIEALPLDSTLAILKRYGVVKQ